MNEFEADEIFGELNRKFANVSLEQATQDDVYHEITFSDVSVFPFFLFVNWQKLLKEYVVAVYI